MLCLFCSSVMPSGRDGEFCDDDCAELFDICGLQKPAQKPAQKVLTDKQFSVMLELFHECNEAFESLGVEWKLAYGRKLQERAVL